MLYKKLLPASIAGAALLASASAFADISITVGSASGAVGGNVVVTYDYSALDADDVAGYQFDITYDPAALTPVDVSTCGNNIPATHSATCTEPGGAGSGIIRSLIADLAFPIDEITPFNIAPIGQWEFQINQPGTHTLTFTNASGSDLTGAPVAITGSDGQITGSITGNAGYASTPSSGGPAINIGAALVGELADASAADITVSEIGDQTLEVTAFPLTGANPGDFTVVTAPFTIADGGADVPVDLTCTPTARGARIAAVEVTNNSINEPAPLYQVSCSGLTPDVTTSTASITLNGLTTDAADPSDTVTVSNAGDAFSAPADVTPTLGGANPGTFTVTPAGTTTIATGGNQVYTVSCDRTTAGNFSATIDFDSTDANGGNADTDSVTVTCEILDEFPTYTSDPAVGATLAFGTVTNGVTSPPIAIDVYNTGNGSGTASELTIGPANITGPDAGAFAVTINNTGPYPVVGSPDGGADIEVTCTPPAAAGALTATLEVTNNDTAAPVTYPLTCSGQTDAVFGSSPADGGTLNLGVVPPATTTPAGDLVFSNAGAVDSYDVSCSVTDPDGVFTFTPDPISFTVGAGASEAASFQCTPTAPGLFQAEVACEIVGADVAAANFFVTCQGQPLVIPTMNRWGLLLMALVLLALGGLAGRRMMA
ncbi:choice-of-anchor D domain-containing protein [Wenzhouxiangella sp. XN79A]|uniref:choice-of-anchor D domain-containing protein n=1 Tax=Wenzhouxiangella sp. XN79A TaxID=2724193 RepID=UPI00144A7906|nr:choice-of-anchor D domain-containing protein [Wenzhouxiangella sp. XN79A]NKI34118.1 choice-of-anchor D domain-containing protein [Wenzhouxiangella sp. XN79A]